MTPTNSELLATESVACLNQALSRLRVIWEEIGIPEDQRLLRTQAVKKHIKELLDMMIAEEESLKARLLNSIDLCRKELNTLCQELNLTSFEEQEESTILKLEKDLRTRVEVLLKQKKERKQELQTLKEQDQDFCDILCTTPYYIDSESVPSLEELDQFRLHLAALTAEKDRRKAEFVSTRREIILYMEELDRVPDTSFEQEIMYEDEEAFCLSKENIDALKQLLHQLEEQISKNEALCTELRSKISALWDRLQITNVERDDFNFYTTGSKPQTIKALQAEVKRLDELKLQNIKEVIEAIRKEFTYYWDKCFYNDEQRKAFAPFYDEEYSEELLYLHDMELVRLKQCYETHKELFESVQKWEENWKLYLEFELEEELKVRIEAWEQQNGNEFLVNGQKFMNYVSEQWELHHQEKEKEKQERQMKKSRQTEEEMFFGSVPKTPGKRRILGQTTPSKVRKINTTSISSGSSNSTIRSAVGGILCHSPVSHLPPLGGKPGQIVRTPSRVIKTPRKGQLESNKENMSQLNGTALSGGCLQTAPSQCNLAINPVASTYSEFARELSKASRSNATSRILNSTITNIPS
ncbi:protein regulator of cytokinesis 1 isoform X3 [Rhinatrema bivittatum]|uniref:protein regulator of cytokinesis 1 isoform X3 n=1 Tax=Rhinatrema bivittatum TaxID=194408 RepID=UPI001125C1EF|nr:protein regulator of cytokinesis 1 isoform X3 [Rhinatrema bivittatum]